MRTNNETSANSGERLEHKRELSVLREVHADAWWHTEDVTGPRVGQALTFCVHCGYVEAGSYFQGFFQLLLGVLVFRAVGLQVEK